MYKKIIIIALITFVAGGAIVFNIRKSKDDFIGTWQDVTCSHKLTITKQSDSVYRIQRHTNDNLVGEFKDDALIGNIAGFEFMYTLKNGTLTEVEPDEKEPNEYKKVQQNK